MAGRSAPLAFRDRLVPGAERRHLSRVLFRARRMAPAALPAGARRTQRRPDVRLLSALAQDSAADRLLQRLAAFRVQFCDNSHNHPGAVGPGYLQTSPTSVAIEPIWRLRCGPRYPFARTGLSRDVRRDPHRAGAAASARVAGDDHWRPAWLR